MFSAAQERFRHKPKEQAHGTSLLDQRLFPANAKRLAGPLLCGACGVWRVHFATMSETRYDELFTAWLALPEAQRNAMDAEFRDIFELSTKRVAT